MICTSPTYTHVGHTFPDTHLKTQKFQDGFQDTHFKAHISSQEIFSGKHFKTHSSKPIFQDKLFKRHISRHTIQETHFNTHVSRIYIYIYMKIHMQRHTFQDTHVKTHLGTWVMEPIHDQQPTCACNATKDGRAWPGRQRLQLAGCKTCVASARGVRLRVASCMATPPYLAARTNEHTPCMMMFHVIMFPAQSLTAATSHKLNYCRKKKECTVRLHLLL